MRSRDTGSSANARMDRRLRTRVSIGATNARSRAGAGMYSMLHSDLPAILNAARIMLKIDTSNRRAVVAGGAASLLLALLVLLLIVNARHGGGGSSLDSGLVSTAETVLPQLAHPSGKLPITDTSLTSFQAWVYDTQPTIASIVRTQHGGQWEQLLMSDPNTLPPQAPLINVPGHPAVSVDPNVVSQALTTGQGQFTTSHQGGRALRVYVVPFKAPAILSQAHIVGVLEVIQPQP